jgi:hypothetical protein
MKRFSFNSQKDSSKLDTRKSDYSENRSSSQDLAAQIGVSGQTFFELLTQSVRKDLSLNQNDTNYEGDDESVDTLSQTSVTRVDNKPLDSSTSTFLDDSEPNAYQAITIDNNGEKVLAPKPKTKENVEEETTSAPEPEKKKSPSTTAKGTLGHENRSRVQAISDTLRNKLGCGNATLLAGKRQQCGLHT